MRDLVSMNLPKVAAEHQDDNEGKTISRKLDDQPQLDGIQTSSFSFSL
ncbi:hypothetical protein BVRB_1g022550 [Beta vulgaris subsp. vulgaris]|nr:hypothetical protein BVRB_1g022550 [Beta vulgaris subsp. vulgaris]